MRRNLNKDHCGHLKIIIYNYLIIIWLKEFETCFSIKHKYYSMPLRIKFRKNFIRNFKSL